MQNKNEARSFPIRRHIILYLNVIDAETGAEMGWLGDLSENGIMIVSEKKLPLDSELHIELKLPASESYSGNSVGLIIELLWSKPDKNPKYYCQGGLIKNIPEESRKDIAKVISKYGFADNRSLKEYTDYTT